MWQLPRQPLTMKEVISQSYALFKEVFGKMHVLLTAFLVLLAIPYMMMPFANITLADLVKSHQVIEVTAFFIIYLLSVFLIYGAFYHQLNLIMRNQPATAQHSLLFVLKKLPVLMLAFILAVIANFVGYALLIIPGIYLITVITIYYPLLVIDDLGPIAGAKQALHLIWGNWWRTALVLLMPMLISMGLMASTAIVMVLIGIILRLPAPIMDLLYAYMQIFLGALFLPVSAVITSVQIYNLKLRKSAVSSETTKTNMHVVNG